MVGNKSININITTGTIFKIVLVFLVLYFAYLVKDILVIIFVSLVFASALGPWVDWMQSKKIPRSAGMIFIYFIIFVFVSLTLYLIIPPIIGQVKELSTNFPVFAEKASSSFSSFKNYIGQYGILDNIAKGFKDLAASFRPAESAGSLFSTVTGFLGSVLSFFLVLVITFYMAVEENAMRKVIWSVAPVKHQAYLIQLMNRMQKKIGLWLRSQLILSLIIFTLTYIGLSILGVNYALILALIAGLTEFIPYLGPTIAAIPAVFLAFTQSPMLAIFVLALYYVIQMTENHIIVPKLMQKVVGLNPIVSIVVLLMGFKLAGVMGAILSIPVATAAGVFLQDVFGGEHV